MRFKKITLKNIRSYKDQELEFPEGSLLLSGDIGSGKTTILLAIEYALFGLQPGQKGTALLRNKENVAEVTLEIDMGDRHLLIERKLRRGPKGVGNENSSITIDGEKIESSVTEIKSKIVNLLGYPLEFVKKNNILFRYTVFTPQEQMKQIILEDSETRLNVLRHIFGIDKYKRIKDNLSILLMSLKSETKLMQGEIKSLEEDFENLRSRKDNLEIIKKNILAQDIIFKERKRIRENLESELKSIEKKIEERRKFSNELEKTNILISTKRETINSIKKEKEELTNLIKNLPKFDDSEYSQTINNLTKIREDLEKFNAAYISINGKLNSFEQDKRDLSTKKDRIFKIEICPTCLQDVPENHKHNILNETERRLSEINSAQLLFEQEKDNLILRINSMKKELSTNEDKKTALEILKSRQEYLSKSRNKLADIEKQEASLEGDISLLIKHSESLKEDILKFSTFEAHHKIKSFELEKALLEEKNMEINVAGLKKELEISSKEISFLEINIQKKEDTKKKLNQLIELCDWLSTQFLNLIDFTERNVLYKLRNEFSSLLRKWFLMLVPENSLDIKIDENFTPIIIQRESEMDYDFLSGGERTAVALAYRLALNQIINSILSKIKTKGIIILDEPTEGFSEEQISKIRDILDELNASQLIIVSHEQKVESFVDNVFKVVKENGISFVRTNNQV